MRDENNVLSSTLEQAEDLIEKVSQPREAVLDSQLIVLVASLGNDAASKLQTQGITFDSMLFAANTLKFLGYNYSGVGLWNENVHDLPSPNGLRDGSSDAFEEAQVNDATGEVELFPRDAWCRLGQEASKYIQQAPTFHLMLGSFTSVLSIPARPVERGHRVKEKEEPRSMPTQVPQVARNQNKATEKKVKRVLDILSAYVKKDDAPLGLYEFVIDPNSFSRTIENLFHLSFLVKDGFVNIECDEEGVLRIGGNQNTPYPSSFDSCACILLTMNVEERVFFVCFVPTCFLFFFVNIY
uniref:Non-structural maintenance of chromosomes element 4 n=1 Tax=Eptatretus burgeri TaxID=7764 RepID=A0A8C4Q1I1_EPTBU